MRMTITGHDLPGRTFCRPDGSEMANVHVGVQLGKAPAELVAGDAAAARWELDVEVVEDARGRDFRGPAVQGKRGERFVYLTWGEAHPGGGFEMFRRAKLMFGSIDEDVLRAALSAARLHADVELTDERGGPVCARVRPPAIRWSVPSD